MLKTWTSGHGTNGDKLSWSSWDAYLPRPRQGKVFTLGGNAGLVYVGRFRARPGCLNNVHSFLRVRDLLV